MALPTQRLAERYTVKVRDVELEAVAAVTEDLDLEEGMILAVDLQDVVVPGLPLDEPFSVLALLTWDDQVKVHDQIHAQALAAALARRDDAAADSAEDRADWYRDQARDLELGRW